ncbi:MAG: glycoside hydrolase family 31 protein, partial [Hyphomicrobiales bacterium]|nr:glycoside hydrolase family 31 protein [Hyphomicrobiales bacterium]
MKALTSARPAGRQGPWILFAADFGVTLAVAILAEGVARVQLRRAGGWRLDRGWSIAPGGLEPSCGGRPRDDLSGFKPPPVIVTDGPSRTTVEAGGLTVEVDHAPPRVTLRRADGSIVHEDRPTQAYFVSRKTHAFSHFAARRAGDRHYGLGDKAGPLDRTGRRFRHSALDPCGFDAELSDPLYKTLPFLLVSGPDGAHGIFHDNLAPAESDLGRAIDNYHGLFRSYEAEDGDLDFWILDGPAPVDVVRRFSWLVGGQALAPKWSLGFGITSMSIADAPDADARVDDFIAKRRLHDVPCDGFHFGSGYTSIGHRRYVFNWNRDKFPDPPATLKRLRDAGMRTVANLKPCLLDDHPRLDEAKAKRILVDGDGAPAPAQFWDGMGFHVDFTNPDARGWWRDGLERAVLGAGFTAAWNDNNEFEIWDEDATCAGDGRPFPQSLARAAQSMLMTKLSHETQAAHAPGERPYAVTRAGAAGLARYGQTWTGDNYTSWKTLRFNLAQGLNMGLSGLFNVGHDVGGFHGPSPDPELFCRFVEFCSLWPRFVMNSWKADGTVSVPWMHPSVLPQVREAMRLRYRLMPHLYAAMHAASARHVPPLRPLFLDFPGDSAAASVDDCFMFGDGLLVAPVLAPGRHFRDVRLPEFDGGWFDFHTGERHPGGDFARVPAPLGRLPILARAGALVAISGQFDKVDPATDSRRALRVFGGATAPSETELYEDDGV